MIEWSNVTDFHFLSAVPLCFILRRLSFRFPCCERIFWFVLFLPSSFAFCSHFTMHPLASPLLPHPVHLSHTRPPQKPETVHLSCLLFPPPTFSVTQSEALPLSARQRARIPIDQTDQSVLCPHYPDPHLPGCNTHTRTQADRMHTYRHKYPHMNSCKRTGLHTHTHIYIQKVAQVDTAE